MRRRIPPILILSVICLMTLSVFGQDGDASGDQDRPDNRGGLLRQLGLSRTQVEQVRNIQLDTREKRQAARTRLAEATRALDQAIYADSVDEAVVGSRLKELQSAQAELARVNYDNELAIRNVLSPDQLIRFREIRRKFNEARDNFQRRRQRRMSEGEEPDRRGGRPGQRPARERQPAQQTEPIRPKAKG